MNNCLQNLMTCFSTRLSFVPIIFKIIKTCREEEGIEALLEVLWRGPGYTQDETQGLSIWENTLPWAEIHPFWFYCSYVFSLRAWSSKADAELTMPLEMTRNIWNAGTIVFFSFVFIFCFEAGSHQVVQECFEWEVCMSRAGHSF